MARLSERYREEVAYTFHGCLWLSPERVELVERLLTEAADTAFLVGAAYGREQERECVAQAIEAARTPHKDMYEHDIYVNDGLNAAARIAREAG